MDTELIIIAVLAGAALAGVVLFSVVGQPALKKRAIKNALGPVTSGTRPEDWTIGPILYGDTNKSVGMPLHPSPEPGAVFAFDFPQAPAGSGFNAPGHVHYVTFRHGPLVGKSRIAMKYRVEMGLDVRIEPRTGTELPSIITLYFQRAGDDWSATGEFETYRWWASFAMQYPITAGEHEIVAPFDGKWTAIIGSNAVDHPAAFQDALTNAEAVGFVLGGGDGLGHGVYATGPARLIVTEFRVE